MASLSLSIVTYNTELDFLDKCIKSLEKSCELALSSSIIGQVSLYVIDNSVNHSIFEQVKKSVNTSWTHGEVYFIETDKNLGYGNAHNIAIQEISSDYHLALNPDVDINDNTIIKAINYLDKNTDVALIAPYVVNENDDYLYLCKRYPNILVLLLRGFFTNSLQNLFDKKLSTYEMRDIDIEKENKDILISSGCFMFFRTSELLKLKGFCSKFFLYFEDFDLSYRMSAMSKIAYVPEVKIVHHGGYAAAKGLKHIVLFCLSSITFFNRYGWKLN